VKKKIALAVLVLLLAAGGTLGAVWYREQTETKVVRGSSTVEFVTTDEPAKKRRPKQEVKRLPWPTYGYDAARTHLAADFDHRPPFKTIWNFQSHEYIEFPPVIAEGRAFFGHQRGAFYALNARTGKVLWKKDFRRCIAAAAAVTGEVVYAAIQNPLPCERTNLEAQTGLVTAMDAKTGRVRWRFDTGAVESSPLVVGNLIYFGSWNHRVYALDRRTGKVRWSYDTGEVVTSSAAYSDGTIYIGGNDGHLFALDAWTGKLRWRASSFSRFGSREYFYVTPTVAYGRVYMGNADGTVYAFGAKSGDLLWAQRAGTYVYTAAAVWNRRVFVGTYDGRFMALDAATGDILWRWEAPGAIHGAPTVMAGLVYFSTLPDEIAPRAKRYVKRGKRGTYALDARTGKLVWKWPGQGLYSPIVADESRVYLTGSTRVLGLRPRKKARTSEAARTLPAGTPSDRRGRESRPGRTRPLR
jgi:outer membrane protein assembly factor BamB